MEGEQNNLEEQTRSEVAFAVRTLYVVEHCLRPGHWAGHPGLHDTLDMWNNAVVKYDQIWESGS